MKTCYNEVDLRDRLFAYSNVCIYSDNFIQTETSLAGLVDYIMQQDNELYFNNLRILSPQEKIFKFRFDLKCGNKRKYKTQKPDS